MQKDTYDVVIIGGGASGLGAGVEAASRGYRVLVLEQYDFGKGTSSKSTKLVHGGIRYLTNLDFELVHEGLEERYSFLKNSPHLAHELTYLIPFYSLWDKIKYFTGVKLYDFLAGKRLLHRSKILNYKQTINLAPKLKSQHLMGSAIYSDGQFDDTRLLITLYKTIEGLGGIVRNYNKVTGLIKDTNGIAIGVKVINSLTNQTYESYAKVIINATGTFTDNILDIDEPIIPHKHVMASQGTHLVIDRQLVESAQAIVIPKTIDKRILFIVPWHTKTILGTTDIAVAAPSIDPIATKEEIDFILNTANKYLTTQITYQDIKSVFAGQRPLVKERGNTNSAKLSRKHKILQSKSGIISLVGGKWTIYRRMGEDVINYAIKCKLLPPTPSITKNLPLFAYSNEATAYPLRVYGTQSKIIEQIQADTNDFSLLHPNLPYYSAEVIYQVRYEMAYNLEDVLVRRTRAVLLDARASIEAANKVAQLMAKELNKDDDWINEQINNYKLIAQQYLVA